MEFESENNSIFENVSKSDTPQQQIPIDSDFQPTQKDVFGIFLDNIKDKLGKSNQEKLNEKAEKDLQKSLQEFCEENEETLLILKSFGCSIKIVNDNHFVIISEEFKLVGNMKTTKDGVEIDENCKTIFETISQIIEGGNRIEDILDEYKKQDFYPFGEIEIVPIKYKGTEIKACKGRLANPQGEIKEILFFKGYEIKSDEQLAKEQAENNKD